MKIALVMRTHDRTIGFGDHIAPGTRKNYLKNTLLSMLNSGVLKSVYLDAFIIHGDAGDTPAFFEESVPPSYLESPEFLVCTATERLTSNQNAGATLAMGAEEPVDWVLFCEDDIAVCRDLIGSVARWLTKWATDDIRLYTFGSAASEPGMRGLAKISVPSFYGTTCYALRREDARSMAAFIEQNPLYNGGRFYGMGEGAGVPVAHDLHFHQWHEKFHPTVKHVGVAMPSFVQHIGVDSGISNRTHEITYKSWLGPDWSYHGEEHE